jgi:hypothetical protein
MRFPWEMKWESELDGIGIGSGKNSKGMGGNRTVPVERKKINNTLLSNTMFL